jgi:hypothetical protein
MGRFMAAANQMFLTTFTPPSFSSCMETIPSCSPGYTTESNATALFYFSGCLPPWIFRRRIDAAEAILDRVEEHEENDDPITYKEYEELLLSLEDVYAEINDIGHRTIKDHVKQLNFDKTVFERQVGMERLVSKTSL